ncbi:MAG: hypothetical protein ACI9G1_000216, partial [Pirellulaceae bacterium]
METVGSNRDFRERFGCVHQSNVFLCALLLWSVGVGVGIADDEKDAVEIGGVGAAEVGGADANKMPQVWRVIVPVPIVGTLDSDVREQIERILGEMKPSTKRPILILQFDG